MMSDKTKQPFIIYGRQPVYEALRSDHPVDKVYIAREVEKSGIRKILSLIEKRNVPFEYLPKARTQQISGPVLHQGIVALADEYRYASQTVMLDLISQQENPFVIILDQIQDPHNLGAIIRTAEIAGVTALILPVKGSALITSTVAKTSAGAIFHSHIHYTEDLTAMMDDLKKKGLTLLAMVQQRDQHLWQSDLRGPLTIVIGSEGTGVRKNIQKRCDGVVSIPGFGRLDSLNASVSAGIVIFEVLRQRRFSVQ
jgi:23S rRNA (guanosine2251-2'-O)-methyltransferase